MKNQIGNFWILLLMCGVGVAGIALVAHGATYNFYFNNTEQGNNSTANPVVNALPTAQPQAQQVPPTSVESQPVAQPSQLQIPAPTPEATSNVTATALAPVSGSTYPRWRLAVSAGLLAHAGDATNPAGTLNFAYALTPGVRLNAFAGYGKKVNRGVRGAFGGIETELRVIRLALGRFDEIIDASLLLGGTTVSRSANNSMSIHGGARVNLNLGEGWSLTAAGRGNLGHFMAEAGLAVRI